MQTERQEREDAAWWDRFARAFPPLSDRALGRLVRELRGGDLPAATQRELVYLISHVDALVPLHEDDPQEKFAALSGYYDRLGKLVGDPDLFLFSDAPGFISPGDVTLQDLLRSAYDKEFRREVGIEVDMHAPKRTYAEQAPIAIEVNGRVYKLAKKSMPREGAPLELQINGQRYKRADDGPEAPASAPAPMSNEEVFAADFGIQPDKVEELKGITDGSGTSLYDIVRNMGTKKR